jgi:hypothetical protein
MRRTTSCWKWLGNSLFTPRLRDVLRAASVRETSPCGVYRLGIKAAFSSLINADTQAQTCSWATLAAYSSQLTRICAPMFWGCYAGVTLPLLCRFRQISLILIDSRRHFSGADSLGKMSVSLSWMYERTMWRKLWRGESLSSRRW